MSNIFLIYKNSNDMCLYYFIWLLLLILHVYFGKEEQTPQPICVNEVFFSSLVKTLISVWMAVWYFPGNFRSSMLVNITLKQFQ